VGLSIMARVFAAVRHNGAGRYPGDVVTGIRMR
jgi:hypothetical protein